jgi:hypothetical protein
MGCNVSRGAGRVAPAVVQASPGREFGGDGWVDATTIAAIESSWPATWGDVHEAHTDDDAVPAAVRGLVDVRSASEAGMFAEVGRPHSGTKPHLAPAEVGFESRCVQFYGAHFHGGAHEIAVANSEKGSDPIVLAYDVPDQRPDGLRLLCLTKDDAHRILVQGVFDRAELYRKLTTGALLPTSGLVGATIVVVPEDSTDAVEIRTRCVPTVTTLCRATYADFSRFASSLGSHFLLL